MSNGAPHETIAAAAQEHVDARGHLALLDAHAVHLAAGGRGYGASSVADVAGAVSWLDEVLGRTSTATERLLYALEMRRAARLWTAASIEDAKRHGEPRIHLNGALWEDEVSAWGLPCSLPLGQVLPTAIERARAALAHANRVAA